MNPSLTEQDSVFLARVEDSVNICRLRSIPKFIGFIDEHQVVLAKRQLNSMGFSNYCFRGGYDDAKRVFLCILPDYMSSEEQDEYPVFCCYFRFLDAKLRPTCPITRYRCVLFFKKMHFPCYLTSMSLFSASSLAFRSASSRSASSFSPRRRVSS